MIVRTVNLDGTWSYGKGKNDYKTDKDAVAQNIATRFRSFLGDCFFAINSGLDWFNLLGAKDELALNLAISTVILNTSGVLELIVLRATRDAQRKLTIQYQVQTIFGVIEQTVNLDLNV